MANEQDWNDENETGAAGALPDMDAEIVIDFSDTPDDQTIPAGEYVAEIVSAVPGKSKASNSAQINVRWKIVDGDYTDRQLFDNVSLHPNRKVFLKQFLVALGLSDGTSAKFTPAELVGQRATLVVNVQPAGKGGDGVDYDARNRIRKVKPVATETLDSLLGA
jgi:hypothetical protein